MTGSQKPLKVSKAELEYLVKSNGGKIVQHDSGRGTVCVGDHSRLSWTIGFLDVLMTDEEPSTLLLCANAEP